MESLYRFIVQPKGERYDNEKKVGDKSLVTNTRIETFQSVSKKAIVIAVPKAYKTEIKVGDEVIIHHNVFRRFYDMKGREKSGRSFLKDDLFFIEDNQFYLYKSDKDWKVNGSFCFIEPVKAKESIYTKINSEEDLTGIIKYIDPKLSEYNLNVGDEVGFTPDSEYEFVIEDQKLYRVRSKNICIKF